MKSLRTVIAATAVAATILHYGSSTLPVATAAEPKGLKCTTIETGQGTNFLGDEVPQKVQNSTMVVKLLSDAQWVPVSIDGMNLDTFKPKDDQKPPEPFPLRTTDQTYVLFDNTTHRFGKRVNTMTLSIDRTTGDVYGLLSAYDEGSKYSHASTTTGHCEPISLKPIL